MGFFNWVRREAPIPDEPQEQDDKEPSERASVLSVAPIAESVPFTVMDRVAAFASVAPRAIGGATMDSSDDGGSSIKGLLTTGQPNVSDALYLWFARQGFIGHQLAAIVAQHWLIYKACAMPARDAVRNGWRVASATGDKLSQETTARIAKLDKRMRIKKQLQEFLTMGRIFGIRVAIPNIDYADPKEAYAAPFNIDGISAGSFKGWTQVDPYWMAPELDSSESSDPANPHFYDPTYWVINGRRYHRSHLVIYRHGELADILKPAYLFGGIPVPQLIMERVYGAERTANEAPMLALSKRTVVYKTNLAKAMLNPLKLRDALNWMGEMWNNYGVRAIDKEEDDHAQFDTSLADLDAVIMTQYQLVAAAAEVPAVKLLGTSAKGFNATGEYDESSYHESLESIQENDLQQFLDRHYLLLAKSAMIEVDLETYWNPLDAPTAAEVAQASLAKAQTGQALVASGAIGAEEERARIARDDDGDYAGIVTEIELDASEEI